MYIQDLSPFDKCHNHVAIGWLDILHPYTQGSVSVEFCERLRDLCLNPAIATRGFHKCQFCEKENATQPVMLDGKRVPGGSGMIHVRWRGNKYIAPTLVFHYVTGHNYRPPDEFIQAIMKPRHWLQRQIDWWIFNSQ